jgi:hypothetical protein
MFSFMLQLAQRYPLGCEAQARESSRAQKIGSKTHQRGKRGCRTLGAVSPRRQEQKKTTIVNYLEEALREKLERDGF